MSATGGTGGTMSGDPRSEIRTAREAEGRGDFALALSTWQRFERSFGSNRDSLVGIGRALRETGHAEEADRILGNGVRLHPDDPELAADHAMVPGSRLDWSTAAARWRLHLARSPTLGLFEGMAAGAAARAGLHDEAEAILQDAFARRGQSLELLAEHATISEYAAAWEIAVRRWDAALALAPSDPALQARRAKAALNKMLQAVLEASGHASAGDAATTPADRIGQMAGSFASLGDNCELGLVQRAFGSEPVDLLRFAAISVVRMIELLTLHLAPLGDPEHTMVTAEGGEYVIFDDRGYLRMHSFVNPDQMSSERYLKKQLARIILLKRVFLAHLAAGDKIFVCKQSRSAISDQTLLELHDGLTRFGDNLLLGIRLADSDHPPGSVTRLTDTILVGHVARVFANDGVAVDLENWARIIVDVFAWQRERRPSR